MRSHVGAMGTRHESGVLLCVCYSFIVPESDVANLFVRVRAVHAVVIADGIARGARLLEVQRIGTVDASRDSVVES